jgi:hypothetical protein
MYPREESGRGMKLSTHHHHVWNCSCNQSSIIVACCMAIVKLTLTAAQTIRAALKRGSSAPQLSANMRIQTEQRQTDKQTRCWCPQCDSLPSPSFLVSLSIQSHGGAVGIATGVPFDLISSRRVLGSTQPPISAVQRLERESDHSIRAVDIYIHSPIRLHGVVLN